MDLLCQPRALSREKSSTAGEKSNNMLLPRRHAQVAQNLRSSLPSTCRWLGPEDVNLIGGPIAAGGVANIWGATHDGRETVVKSYRRCTSSDVTQVVEVRHNRCPRRARC